MIVMKFGGSSLKDANKIYQAAMLIAERAELNPGVAVVLSALQGVTDELFQLTHAETRDETLYLISKITDRHIVVLQELQCHLTASEYRGLEQQIHKAGERLIELTTNTALPTSIRHTEILTTGERLSVQFMLTLLESFECNVGHLPAEQYMHVQGSLRSAEPDLKATTKALESIEYDNGMITLTEGFYGITPEHQIACFSRNGSDLSAAILGAALFAEKVEIWTDVDGVYNTDPHLVPDAKLIEYISYQELKTFAHLGASVVYAPTLDYLEANFIPLQIKNSLNPDAKGTLITADIKHCDLFGTSLIQKVKLHSQDEQISVLGFEKQGSTSRHLFEVTRDTFTTTHSPFTAEPDNQIQVKNYSLVSVIGEHSPLQVEKLLASFDAEKIHAIPTHQTQNSYSILVSEKDAKKALSVAHRTVYD